MSIVKECSKCKETKPVSDFYRSNKSKDGFQGYCKQCSNEYAKNYHKKSSQQQSDKKRRELTEQALQCWELLEIKRDSGDRYITCREFADYLECSPYRWTKYVKLRMLEINVPMGYKAGRGFYLGEKGAQHTIVQLYEGHILTRAQTAIKIRESIIESGGWLETQKALEAARGKVLTWPDVIGLIDGLGLVVEDRGRIEQLLLTPPD